MRRWKVGWEPLERENLVPCCQCGVGWDEGVFGVGCLCTGFCCGPTSRVLWSQGCSFGVSCGVDALPHPHKASCFAAGEDHSLELNVI